MKKASVSGLGGSRILRCCGSSARFLLLLTFFLGLGGATFSGHAASTSPGRANVVVILADDLGWPDLGVSGAKDLKTPNLDALARSGVRFRNGYVAAPVCSPSRAGLMTGRCPQRFGHEINPGPNLEMDPVFGLPLTESTVGDRMKELGYATGWVGKSHLGALPPYYPQQRGFDEFFGFLEGHHDYVPPYLTTPDDPIRRGSEVVTETNYLTTAFGRECVEFIGRHAGGPFFLYAPFNAVHFPMEAPEDYLKRFDPASFGGDLRRWTNAAMLAVLDDAVGEIMAKLRALNVESNTLVIFASDNGAPSPSGIDANGSVNFPLRGYKGSLYEGGIRVPFLMQWKGVLVPREEEAMVSTLDILPTAVAAGGGNIPGAWQLDGVNLLPYLTGQTMDKPHAQLFWRMQTAGGEETSSGPSAMRDERWKLVKPTWQSRWELYDLSKDVGESVNVADEHPEILDRMTLDFAEWQSGLAEPRWDYNTKVVVSPEFVRDDIRLGSVGVSYGTPDFLVGGDWVSFQDADGKLWAGKWDRRTGRLVTETGRDVLVDGGLAVVPDLLGRARWSWTDEGSALFYSKPGSQGRLEIWRAVLKGNEFVKTRLTQAVGVDHFGVRVVSDARGTGRSPRVLFNVGSPTGSSSLVWAESTPFAVQTALLRPYDVPLNGRWLPGGVDVVYGAYPQAQATVPQLVRWATSTGATQLLTTGVGVKTDMSGFRSAELGGELMYATIVNRTNVVVYRELVEGGTGRVTNVMTLSFPASVDQSFLFSLEPLEGGVGWNGVSYFALGSYSSPDPLNALDSAIWILGVGMDSRPLIRRLDGDPEDVLFPAVGGRLSPQLVRGERELFCFYSQVGANGVSQLRLARTGVRVPDREGMASGLGSMRFESDFEAGTQDEAGWWMNPTETLQMVSHGGVLFAGQGSLESRPYPEILTNPPPEWSGAQILVKTSSVSPWRVDHTLGLSPYPFHLRVDVLKEVAITTDANGRAVKIPQGLLLAGLGDIGETGSKQASVRMRDDRTGLWKESHVTTATNEAYPLSFVSHQEGAVTRVFVGLSNGQIHRGAYSTVEANMVWDTVAEAGGGGAVNGLVEANGVVYGVSALVQTGSNGPVTGGVYVRHDSGPSWQLVYRWPYPKDLYLRGKDVKWMQGLTVVPEPHGEPNQVLLGARSWPGVIERLDPKRGNEVTVELEVRSFLARQWNDERVREAGLVLGYQGFTAVVHPLTGEKVHVMGMWVDRPWESVGNRRGTFYLIRHEDATYELGRIDALEMGHELRASRCFAASPFGDDLPGTMYVGGYDVAGEASARTGWLLRGTFASWPSVSWTRTGVDEIQLEWPALDEAWVLESKSRLDVLSEWEPVSGLSTRSNTNQTQNVRIEGGEEYFRLRGP